MAILQPKILNKTLKFEGGYVADPDDHGRATKYGVSLNFLLKAGADKFDMDHDGRINELLGDIDNDGDVDAKDIICLDLDFAANLYDRYFWTPIHGEEIQSELIAGQLFDIAVNCGTKKAGIILQCAINDFEKISIDGVIGEQTLEAVKNLTYSHHIDLNNRMVDYRLAFYKDIIKRRPINKKYWKGWSNRALSFRSN